MKKTIFLSIITLLSVFSVQAKHYYVKNVTNATDWSHIVPDANNVIVYYTTGNNFNAIFNGYAIGDTVWVAKGTYTVNLPITPKSDMKIYGGFAGTETSLSQRAKIDLDGNGIVEPWEFKDSTVVTTLLPVRALAFGTLTVPCTNTIVDGINIQNVNNISRVAFDIVNFPTSADGCVFSNSIVKNCIVSNDSIACNAAVYANNGIVKNCLIEGNSVSNNTALGAASSGGGLRLSSPATGTAGAMGIGCVIRGNKNENISPSKSKGGGVFIQSAGLTNVVKLINCVVYNNQCVGTTGGVYCQAATGAVATDKNVEVLHCTIVNNTSTTTGGGINVPMGCSLYNSIIWNNTANTLTLPGTTDVFLTSNNTNIHNIAVGQIGGQAIYINVDSINIKNMIKRGLNKNATLSNTVDAGIDTITKVIGLYAPRFTAPTTFVGCPTTPEQISAMRKAAFTVMQGSPAIDFGSADYISGTVVDLMNNARVVTTPDLGAYEYTASATEVTKVSEGTQINVSSKGMALVVQGLKGKSNVVLYNLNGTILENIKCNESSLTIPVSNKGIYVLKVVTLDGSKSVKVVI